MGREIRDGQVEIYIAVAGHLCVQIAIDSREIRDMQVQIYISVAGHIVVAVHLCVQIALLGVGGATRHTRGGRSADELSGALRHT